MKELVGQINYVSVVVTEGSQSSFIGEGSFLSFTHTNTHTKFYRDGNSFTHIKQKHCSLFSSFKTTQGQRKTRRVFNSLVTSLLKFAL